MNIGEIIKERRTELNLTLEQIGEYVGVGKSTVRKWENGFIENMKRDKIALISEILKLSPLTFITGEITYLEETTTGPISPTLMSVTSKDEQELIQNFNQLNGEGKERLLENSREYTELSKYKKDSQFELGKKQA